MKQTTIETFDNEQITDAFQSLDIKPLAEKLSEMFGFNLELTKQLNTTYNFGSTSNKINIFCEENLVDRCGIFRFGLSEAKIQDFGVKVHKIIEYDDDLLEKERETKKEYIPVSCYAKTIGFIVYITLDIRFKLTNGGSNGISILSASYDINNKTWSFSK